MRRFLSLLLMGSLSLLSACAPESLADLGRHFAIQGVVTDLGTATAGDPNGSPLAGVTVTLVSSDRFAPVVTGADGSYLFSPVLQGDGLVLIFQKAGYAPETKNLSDLIPFPFEDDAGTYGSCTVCGPDGLSWTQPMYRMSGTPGTIIGRVVANSSSSNQAKPISGATVTLLSEDKLAAVTTDANGFFSITGLVQLDDLRLSAVAPGFLTYYTSTFNIDPTSSCMLPSGMLANPCLDYQSGFGDLALQAETVITGVVTDATTMLPIAGVNVTLVSPDALPAATTTAAGVYSFSVYDPETTNTTPWSLIFSDAAYSSSVVTVSNLGSCGQVQLPSGATQPTCYYNVALTRTQGTLAGTVRFDGAPAAGAVIIACSSSSEGLTTACAGANFIGQQTLPANGQFSFAVQVGQSYTLNVLPWDSNNDGVTDTQFFSSTYGPITGEGSTDYSDIAINLQAPSKTVIASSFVNGTGTISYPVTVAAGQAGGSNLVEQNAASLFVQFGAPVDPTLTTFQLQQIATSSSGVNTISPPIPITVTWSQTVVATIVPATALTPFDPNQDKVFYQLEITSLRWGDGTIGVAPVTGDLGSQGMFFNFNVYAAPTLLANPTPAVYLGNQTTTTTSASGQQIARIATQYAVDEASIWYLDKNNDLLISNASTVDLTWPAVPGAVSYSCFARNTTTNSASPSTTNPPQQFLDWASITCGTLTGTVDPSGNSTVVAAGVNFTALTTPVAGAPWAFGNTIQFAVVANSQTGFTAPINAANVLTLGDTFGGLISSSLVDTTATAGVGGLTGQWTPITERGDLVNKTITVKFTEDMQGGSTPALSLASGTLALLKTNAFAWGPGSGPATTAPNTGTWAYFNVQLQNKQIPCTEIVASRQTGDTLLPVRDASLFPSGARLVILQAGSSAPVAEATVGSNAPGVVSLTAGLAALPPAPSGTLVSVNQSSLACALSGSGAAAVGSSYTTSYPGGTTPAGTDPKVITLSSAAAANAFFIGQQVLVYEPANATNNTAPIADTRTVIGVDTAAGAVIVNPAVSTGNSSVSPPTGHTSATVVVPLPPLGGEYALRGATDIGFGGSNGGLKVDAVATTPTLTFASSPGTFPPMVGDTLLVDGDGDLTTTTDQSQLVVSQIVCTPATGATAYTTASCVVTTATPTTFALTQARSRIIHLGDSFTVSGTKDTSGNTPLNTHGDQFSAGGLPADGSVGASASY